MERRIIQNNEKVIKSTDLVNFVGKRSNLLNNAE
jgi:hypothetical protein